MIYNRCFILFIKNYLNMVIMRRSNLNILPSISKVTCASEIIDLHIILYYITFYILTFHLFILWYIMIFYL